MAKKIGHTLPDFPHKYGAPDYLTYGGAQVQKKDSTLFMKNIQRIERKPHISSPYRPNKPPEKALIR